MQQLTTREVVGRVQCPNCIDKSQDNLVLYKDTGSYCYACGFYEVGGKRNKPASLFANGEDKVNIMPKHTIENILGKRKVLPEVIQKYGVNLVEQAGEYKVVFPITDINGSEYTQHFRDVDLSTGTMTREMRFTKGTKVRVPIFGANTITKQTKIILITEGETDALIAASALNGRNDIAVVGLVGAAMASRAAMFAVRYWTERKLVLAFDNDGAGQEAIDNFADKVKEHSDCVLSKLSIPKQHKDIGEWLVKDASVWANFADLVYDASPLMKSGILNAEEISEQLHDYLKILTESEYIKLKFAPKLSSAIKIMPGKLMGILGDAGAGKSTLVEHIMLEAITQKRRVFVLSAEMCAAEVALKMLRTIRREPLHDTEYLRELDPDYFDMIADESRRLLSWMNMVDDFGSCSMEKLEGYLQELAGYGQAPDIVVVDHLLAIAESLEPNALMTTCEKLKEMARRYNCCVILLCHIRKPAQQKTRTIYRPVLADAYGSNGLQIYADCVLSVAMDNEKQQTLVETIKKERIGGKWVDIVLCYEDFQLLELDETNGGSVDYGNNTEEEFEEQEPVF